MLGIVTYLILGKLHNGMIPPPPPLFVRKVITFLTSFTSFYSFYFVLDHFFVLNVTLYEVKN